MKSYKSTLSRSNRLKVKSRSKRKMEYTEEKEETKRRKQQEEENGFEEPEESKKRDKDK